MEFDRDTLRRMRPIMEARLKEFADEFGVRVRVGDIRFSPSDATFKVEVSTVDESADGTVVSSREARDLTSYAALFGADPSWLGKTFTSDGGRRFEVVGLSPRAKSYPIVARDTGSGKRYKFSVPLVRRLLSGAA